MDPLLERLLGLRQDDPQLAKQTTNAVDQSRLGTNIPFVALDE